VNYLEENFELTQKSERFFKITTTAENLLESMQKIYNHTEFRSLSMIACTDWIEDGVFALSYIIADENRSKNLQVVVEISREQSVISSLVQLYPQSEVMERELHEMYGILFDGNSTLYEFALEGWQEIPPMRREFDTLEFVEKTYSFRDGRDDNVNVKEEMKRLREQKKREKELAESTKAEEEGGADDGE